ncbi:hypothetical protein K435DRAFT_780546, partial [Dendrothele bispora CBS 962.96]
MSNYSTPSLKLVSVVSGPKLTDDAALEELLSDIPNFSVGIMAFGVSTFWLFMRKRISLLATLIYLSALLGFVAGIFDLIQLLARGPTNIAQGTGIDTSITALVDTREVLLSLSRGAIFLFFWSFIAEKPRGEPPPDPTLNNSLTPREDTHSASWKRWGLLGWVLERGLLLASISVPILQIIWRIINSNTIYTVESTIEIVVTGLFLLKVLLNIFLSPLAPWWKPFKFYLIPIVALLLNLGLAIGNLVCIRFTDTTLGRFLQSVELYILILFVMIDAFYKVPTRPPRSSRKIKGTSSFITPKPPDFSLPPPVSMGGRDTKEPNDPIGSSGSYGPYFTANVNAPMTRSSVISRLSSWMVPRRNSVVPSSSNLRSSWREDQNSEKIDPNSIYEVQRYTPTPSVKVDLPPQQPIQPEIAKSPEVATKLISPQVDPVPEPASVPAPVPDPTPAAISTPDPPLTIATNYNVPPSPPPEIEIIRESRPSTGFSFSYYGMERGSRRSLVNPEVTSRQDTPSPIYGLNGIINPSSRRDSGISFQNRGSSNSFDELLRQQNELDKTIAALRLFSPQSNTTTFEESSRGPEFFTALEDDIQTVPHTPQTARPPVSSSLSSERVRSIATRSSQRQDSMSEISLSNFPAPPAESALTPTRASFVALRSKRSSFAPRREDIPSLDPSLAPSFPTSPNRIGARADRFGSAGTQYDVTSFIGDLTSPGGGGLRPSVLKNVGLSDVESEDEGSFVQQSARPVVLESAVPVLSGPTVSTDELKSEPEPPATASSGAISPTREYPVLKPLFLGNVTTYPTVSSPLTSQSRVAGPRRPARGRFGLPSQPRLAISAPRPRESVGTSDNEAYRYENPRRAPTVNPSTGDVAPS